MYDVDRVSGRLFWERVAVAALRSMLEDHGARVDEAVEMSAECADKMLDAYLLRFDDRTAKGLGGVSPKPELVEPCRAE